MKTSEVIMGCTVALILTLYICTFSLIDAVQDKKIDFDVVCKVQDACLIDPEDN